MGPANQETSRDHSSRLVTTKYLLLRPVYRKKARRRVRKQAGTLVWHSSKEAN
jgi:hypothetical protein